MLLKKLDTPDLEVGAFVHELLHTGDWLARRVDSVRFVDADSVQRQVTFDVDTRWIADRQPPGLVPEGLVVAPLTLLTKQLLVDADLRAADGSALHIARRPVDSYLAWTSIAHTARDAGYDLSRQPRVSDYVRRIITGFPKTPVVDIRKHQPSWDLPIDHKWDSDDETMWSKMLTGNWELRYELWTHTYSFPLVTYLPSGGVEIAKFSSRQDLRAAGADESVVLGERIIRAASKLALRPTALIVPMPGPEQATRAHLRLSVPEGLEWSRIAVNRVIAPGPPQEEKPGKWQRLCSWWSFLVRMRENGRAGAGDTCEVVLTPDRAHVYASELGRKRLQAHLAVHVPLPGFLRAAFLSVVLSFVTLLAGLILHDDLQKATSDVDAAVALLLLAPTLLSAYLVRPGEHALVSDLLRWVRYLITMSMVAVYVAAGASILYLQSDPGHHRGVWQVCLVICGVPVTFVGLACTVSFLSGRKSRRRGLETRLRSVGVVESDAATMSADIEAPPAVG